MALGNLWSAKSSRAQPMHWPILTFCTYIVVSDKKFKCRNAKDLSGNLEKVTALNSVHQRALTSLFLTVSCHGINFKISVCDVCSHKKKKEHWPTTEKI